MNCKKEKRKKAVCNEYKCFIYIYIYIIHTIPLIRVEIVPKPLDFLNKLFNIVSENS